LVLDCEIKQQAKFLSERLESIFHPQSRSRQTFANIIRYFVTSAQAFHPQSRSRQTFANIIRYFVTSAQADPRKLCWFKDAVEWARVARIDGKKDGGKALFVATVKDQTGYRSNPKLLSGKSGEKSRARASPAA
jgi:hypothetical protein